MSDTRIDTSSDNECHDQDEDMAKSFFADFQAIAFERARAETAESALATALSDNERLGRERDAILKRAQTAEQWLREANFLVREHKSACADAISQAQAAEAERDTLLAQVEKMTGVLKRIANLSGTAGGEFIKNENGFRHERGVFANEIARAALTKEPS